MQRSWVEIDLETFSENVTDIQRSLTPDTTPILVIKADAYGHGARELAHRAEKLGVRFLAVAYLEEALKIREVAGEVDILILGVVDPAYIDELLAHRITPIVADLEHGKELSAAAQARGTKLPVHVKIDTGMGRIGLPWRQGYEQFSELCAEKGLDIRGTCSHFAMVEASEPQAASNQIHRFSDITGKIEEQLGRKLFKHISSSRAFLMHEEWDLNGVRPGIVLFGYGATEAGLRFTTQPILQWKTTVMQVKTVPAGFPVGYYSTYETSRPTDIAVLACGYTDGYLRTLSNRGSVLINGKRCPVIGRVSMNWMTVDLGPNSGVKRGDEAVLIGKQGDECIWANELAALCRTIPYEILTGIDSSIQRRYTRAKA